jgi:hypothetical protein
MCIRRPTPLDQKPPFRSDSHTQQAKPWVPRIFVAMVSWFFIFFYLLRQTAALPDDKGPLCVTMPKEPVHCIQWTEPGQLVCLFPVKWSFPRPRVDLGWQGGIPAWTPADPDPPWTLRYALGQAVRGHKFPAPAHRVTWAESGLLQHLTIY